MPNPTQTARATWQDLYALGKGTTMSTPNYAQNSVYAGASGLLLNEHPHIKAGQTTIEKEKTTGASEGLVGRGMEVQQGHKVPTFEGSMDATAHNVVQLLKAFFHNGYSLVEGTAYNSSGYHAVFRRYTDPNPNWFLTLVRKFSDSSADSHRAWGMVCSQFSLTGNENENVTVGFQLIGQDVTYEYTWNAAGGDSESFDTSLNPLQWKNTHIAVGTIVEGYPGFSAAISGSAITFAGSGAPADMTQVIEVGSYIVFESAPNTKYKIIDVTASGATIEDSGVTVSASQRFKIMNLLHTAGINITLNNNVSPRAYDETSIHRFVLNRLSGEGSFNIPFSEISAGVGGNVAEVGFTGSKWLKFFLEGGVVRLHIWWGDVWDAVEDSTGDGDLGLSLTIRASDDGIEDENGEMVVTVPFTIRGDRETQGTVLNKAGAGLPANGFYGVSGSGVDWVALGSEILTTNPEIGIHRGDTIVVGSQSSEIRYVANSGYLYTWAYLSNLSSVNGAQYTIQGDAVRIKCGFGYWRVDQ